MSMNTLIKNYAMRISNDFEFYFRRQMTDEEIKQFSLIFEGELVTCSIQKKPIKEKDNNE